MLKWLLWRIFRHWLGSSQGLRPINLSSSHRHKSPWLLVKLVKSPLNCIFNYYNLIQEVQSKGGEAIRRIFCRHRRSGAARSGGTPAPIYGSALWFQKKMEFFQKKFLLFWLKNNKKIKKKKIKIPIYYKGYWFIFFLVLFPKAFLFLFFLQIIMLCCFWS